MSTSTCTSESARKDWPVFARQPARSPNLKEANEWTRDQFTAMGCQNAHLEDWGEFGMGWRQLNAWMRMTAPDTAVFIAQALPWSPSSHGPITGGAVWVDAKDEKDLEKYKGKLAGKVVQPGASLNVRDLTGSCGGA